MKFNMLMAAVVLLAAGSANAAMDRPQNGNGSLFFVAYDNIGSPVSVTIDLGLNVDHFRTFDDVNFSYLIKDGLTSGDHKIVWNFADNTVTTTTPDSIVRGFNPTDFVPTVTTTGELVGSITGNQWSAEFAKFAGLAQAGDIRWAVGAADGGNNFFVSTGSNIEALGKLSSQDLVNFQLTDKSLYQSSNLEGTHPTANNGANAVVGTASPSVIEPSIWGVGDGWVGNSNFGATTLPGVTTNNFFLMEDNTHTLGVVSAGQTRALDAVVLNDMASWTFDFTRQTLTYQTRTLEVPEPATYALMGMGLVGIALVAQRRRA